jgi:hypothetical protein
VRFDFGVTSTSLFVPIARDRLAERNEWVRFQCFGEGDVVGSESIILDGKVLRNR